MNTRFLSLSLACATLSLAAGPAPVSWDAEKHSVSFNVVSTDCGVDMQLEFLFVGPNSDRDYEAMFITQAPQGYPIKRILKAHDEAEKRGIESPTSSSELLIELGEEVHIFIGERQNIKVTTPEDIYTLRSWYYYERYRSFAKEEMRYGL